VVARVTLCAMVVGLWGLRSPAFAQPLAAPERQDPERASSAPSAAKEPRDESSADGEAIDYSTTRTEVAGAPLIGGNSDIGFEFGGVLTATHFGENQRPYRWNSDLVLAASVKDGPSGAEIAQQNYLLQLDIPDLIPRRLRFIITGSFQRTVNYGYYGVSGAPALSGGVPSLGRFYQFDQREAILRTLSQVVLSRPYMLLVAANLRYLDPRAYRGSQLALDVEAGRVGGLHSVGIGALGVGVGYDTRDNEFFPTRGVFHQFGVKGSYGVPASASVSYGSIGAVICGYVPIGSSVVVAGRALVDTQMGHVPFYDLSLGGIFQVDELPGGPGGIRGVPIGRYRGLIKAITNLEVRARVLQFQLWSASFRLGGAVFADVGRAFRDYRFRTDAGAPALNWGSGAGLYLQWGQAALFRADAAYSPDAALNGGFPLGIYVAQGVMF
jgi:hypothetical protein